MKKILALVLTSALCLCCLASCGVSYTQNGFFSEEFLTQNKLSDMPMPPHLDDSVYGSASLLGNMLYLNLTDEEYEQYVEDLLNYLRAKEDIYYLGFSVGGRLLAEMLPYDEIAPITDSYNTKKDEHHIFFATEDGLGNSDFLNSPVEFVISRESGKLTFNNYEYNTQIGICDGNLARAAWNLCGAEHTYDEGIEYIIPESEQTITEYTCVFCGHYEFSSFIGDLKTYNITIEDTDVDHYLVHRSSSCISGLVVEMLAEKIDGAELKFIVNGTEIPPRDSENGEWWIYEFIMPCKDVVIFTELVEQSTLTE